MNESSFSNFMKFLDKQDSSFEKSTFTIEFLLKRQSEIYAHVFKTPENIDIDDNWDIEENFIQLYNEMYELLKRFVEIEYVEKPLKTKGKETDINLLRNVLFGDTFFITPNLIKIYSKTFMLGLQELYKFVKIKPFDIFMILVNILSEDKLPNINQKTIKIKNKNYGASEIKNLCVVLITELIIKFGFYDKKYLTLFPQLLTTIFKLLKINKDTNMSFTVSVLKLLKSTIEIQPLTRDLSKKFLKYFHNILHEVNENENIYIQSDDTYLKIKKNVIDLYFVILADHKQLKDAGLIEDIIYKLGTLKFDLNTSPQVANLISNSLLHYTNTGQLGYENVLEIYSRLITDNLDSRLGLVTAFESIQIYLSYFFLSNISHSRTSFFSTFIKPFIEMTIPYIEINNLQDISVFNELFNKTVFDGVISKHLGKEELLSILNTIFMQAGFIVDDLEKLNITLFYLDLSLKIIEFLRNDINDELLIEKIESKIIKLATESDIFQIRVNANIILKSFYKFIGNGKNIKIKRLLNDSFKFITGCYKLVDINEFQFHKAHGHALVISNMGSIMLNENDFVLQILVTVVNFLKNTSSNLIINGKISFYKILVSWIMIIGILGNGDSSTKEVLSLQRNQLMLLWNNLFLSSNFGVSIENEDELYKFLEIQYHALTALFNFIRNCFLNDLELKQLKKYLIKLSNIRYSITSKIIDKLLLQIELRVLEIYSFLIETYIIEFNNNSLLLLMVKNMTSIDMFENNNKNILKELFVKEKNNSSLATKPSLKKFLTSNNSYVYGLNSLIRKDRVAWNDCEIFFNPWVDNSYSWDYDLQLIISDPFPENIYNDHLKILTSVESEVKNKKLATSIIDISMVLFANVFQHLNMTIQLSILENLHSNLISKNLIADRLETIHINALVVLNKIIRDSLNPFKHDVALFIKNILEAISQNAFDDYKIMLLSESLATINQHLSEPSINNEAVLTRLTGDNLNEKYLSIMELSHSLKLNFDDVANNNDICNLLGDFCQERENKKILQWGLIALNNVLDCANQKGINKILVTKILDTIQSVLIEEENIFYLYEIICDTWSKLIQNIPRDYLLDSKVQNSVFIITNIILNFESCCSTKTIVEIVEPLIKTNCEYLNKDFIKHLCKKFINSYFYTVNSNTNESINFFNNDLFELTSINTKFIHIIFDYIISQDKSTSSMNDMNYYVIVLLLLSFNDAIFIKKFKIFFNRSEKLSILLKAFNMRYKDLLKSLVNQDKLHLELLKSRLKDSTCLSVTNNESLSDNFSTFIHFKETLLETIVLQVNNSMLENKSLSEENISCIIDICYDVSLNFIKDSRLSELSLYLLKLVLSSNKEIKLSSMQTSQISTIIILNYENTFSTTANLKLLFSLISTVIPLFEKNNTDILSILISGLNFCTKLSSNSNETVYIGKMKLYLGTYSNFMNELKVFILMSWAVYTMKFGLKEISDYINQLIPLWIIIIRDSLVKKITETKLSDNIFVVDDDLILIIKTFVLIVGDSNYKLPEELCNEDVISLLYICYVSCVSYMLTNIKSNEKTNQALNVIRNLLFSNNGLNIFSSMNINTELHNEFIAIISTIIKNDNTNDSQIIKVLDSMYIKLPFNEETIDTLYDYLSLNIQILQKYLPVISSSGHDLYQQIDLNDYHLIEEILSSISNFIDRIEESEMKLDLLACVLNYIGNVINKAENFNYYYPYVITSLQKLLAINSNVAGQFWKVIQEKIETSDQLLQDYYLQLLSSFVNNVPELSFNIDKFVNRLSNHCTDKDIISNAFKLFNQETFQSNNKNVLFKKCCRQLLYSLKKETITDVDLLVFKFNLLFKNNLTPGSYKLIFIFYSKLLDIRPDASEQVKKLLLCLFGNDSDVLIQTVLDYSKDGEDYSDLL
ncbi:hypothetical protein QEN19_002884 [Hanseniaspora menglaensis]